MRRICIERQFRNLQYRESVKKSSHEMMKELETTRTRMRKLMTHDAKSFYTLNLDEEVIKYTGDEPFENIQAAEEFLRNYDQYEKFGVGRLAVIDKSTLNFIGWCGLKYSPQKDEYDIGFRFFRHYWNKGFATETASKCLEYASNELKINRIVGRAMKGNVASIRVLEKLGMRFRKKFKFGEYDGVIYEIKF